MSQEQHRELIDAIESNFAAANSPIMQAEGRRAIVELAPDHPGFSDPAYRDRRNDIAQIALDYVPGEPVPDAPYTEEEHAVWHDIREQMAPAHVRHACRPYLEFADELALPRDRIPQLREVNERLESLSEFRLEPVAGLVHPKVFLSTLARRTFLSTQYIRHHSTPDYTPEPDVVHELIGHAAQLANPELAELNHAFGRAAGAITSGDALQRLTRVAWFTLEFGVLREQGELKAYGAGLLSSFGELEAMHGAELHDLDLERMEVTEYDVTQYQPLLFCADSYAHLRETLIGYCDRLAS